MKRFNVATKKVFPGGQQWNTVGVLAQFPPTEGRDEGYTLELNMFPETKFYLFEQKPKEPDEPGTKG